MKIGKSEGSLIVWKDNTIRKYPQIQNILDVILNPSILKLAKYEELQSSPDLELPIISNKIICLAKNYEKHAKEMGVDPKILPKTPSLFLKPSTTLIGPDDYIIFPSNSQEIHHEVELAVIIGKKGKNISVEESLDYIFGYTILLDITARDIQTIAKKNGQPWFQAKGYDTFAPLGPLIVTPDEIKNPQNLEIELYVNKELRQKGNTKDMIFDIKNIICYCSSIVTLEPGDIIATGTPEGVGPLHVGDEIEAIIDPIGVLKVGVKK
ncbi:fumarylacetoacetate hydrolase family protein [Candidatus Hodarchaeum mangrovi]